jgi:hypothetical protein
VAEVISNTGQFGVPDCNGNPLGAAIDSAVNLARRRLWIAVPLAYTCTNSPWLLSFIQRMADVSARGSVDARAYLRLHSKVIVSDDAALVMTDGCRVVTRPDGGAFPTQPSTSCASVTTRFCARLWPGSD